MEKAFLILIFILSLNSWALGGYETLAGDDKKVADILKEALKLSNVDTYNIYDGYIKDYLNTKSWHYHGYDNETITSSKIGKSDNRTYYMNLVTDTRFINLSFIKFNKEKQIQILAIETLPRTTQVSIDKYDSLKSDKDFTIDSDQAEFSSFSKKGYSKRVKTLIYSGSGGIQYTDLFIYNLKQ